MTVFRPLLLISLLLTAGCATVAPTLNTPNFEARVEQIPSSLNNDDTLLILTFSGGGMRAAALSYGVLKALQETPITAGKYDSVLDKVDLISSVSGGSFTAAYYGLYGKRIFTDFEHDFLRQPVQSELLNKWLLSPSNWRKLGSAVFNRSDLAAEYYDARLFDNQTFADIRADVPAIVINATDISTGSLFSFTPENMHWICSELASYPISRAVTASSAVPGAFSPIMLENYSGCSVSDEALNNPAAKALQEKSRYPYLHLVDGGISDNLGVRAVLRIAHQQKNLEKLLRQYGLKNVKNIAVVVVNAADEISPSIAQSPEEPSAAATISAVTTIQSRRYNTETLQQLNAQMNDWQTQAKQGNMAINFHIIELDFSKLPQTLSNQVSLYETSLELTDKQIDTLIYSGRYLLKNNAEFQQFLQAINNDD